MCFFEQDRFQGGGFFKLVGVAYYRVESLALRRSFGMEARHSVDKEGL